MPDFSLHGSIQSFLSSLGKKAIFRIGVKYLCWALSSLLFSWHLSFLCDRFFDTPKTLRILILSMGLAGALLACFKFILFCRHTKNSKTWLAKQVRKIYRTKGERLLGIVELARDYNSNPRNQGSSKLFEAAQFKMEKELVHLKPTKIFTWIHHLRTFLFLGVFLLSGFISAVLVPEIIPNSINRWFFPWASVERVTLTRLDIEQSPIVVPKEESYVIRFPTSPDSHIHPSQAEISSKLKPFTRQVSFKNSNFFEFILPPLEHANPFNVSCGDFRSEILIIPKTRPHILDCRAIITWPKYTQIPITEEKLSGPTLKILDGSKLEIQGSANRALSAITLREPFDFHFQSLNSEKFSFPLHSSFKSGPMELRFSDLDHLSQSRPLQWNLELFQDEEPTALFAAANDLSPLLEFETRNLQIQIKDDLGIESYSLEMNSTRGEMVFLQRTILKHFIRNDLEKEINLSFPFEPGFFGLEDGDQVSFTILVKDRFPNRILTRSKPLKLIILGSEKHAQRITEKMEDLMDQVADIARDQETLLSETRKQSKDLEIFNEPELNPEEREDLGFLSEKQRQISDRLSTLAQKGLALLNNASNNPIFDASNLKDFGHSFGTMKEIATGQMEDSGKEIQLAQNLIREAANLSLSTASQMQFDALQRLQALLDTFSEQMEELEAKTLAQRLRNVENTEREISRDLTSILPETLGKTRSLLSQKYNSAIQSLEIIQAGARIEAKEIQSEISRYFERTGVHEYQKVSLLMQESRTHEGMKIAAEKIKANVGFQALEDLDAWQKKFAAWALLLENQLDESSQAGGEGESSSQDFAEQILALIKIREGQKQVLQKTSFFHQQNLQNEFPEWLVPLSNQQHELAIDLTDTQISLANEALNPLFDEAHTAMSNAHQLLQSKGTGHQTQSEQKKAKDLVSDLVNLLVEGQNSGEDGKSKDELSMIDFLLMKNQTGQKQNSEGKSPSAGKQGGGFNKARKSGEILDNNNGKNLKLPRTERKSDAGSTDFPSVPVEFKEAMERYIEQME
jgi:hypothetical protein